MNILGIPIVPYKPYMGWYDCKQTKELISKISELNTFEEQLKKMCIRFSSQYRPGSSTWSRISTDYEYLFQDEAVRCNNVITLYEYCKRRDDSILELVVMSQNS